MSYIAVNSLKIKRSSTGYQEKEKECIFNFNHKTSHRFHASHNITTMAIYIVTSIKTFLLVFLLDCGMYV